MKTVQVRRCLLAGVAILELLAIVIIVILNAGGQQSDRDDVMAPDTYLLEWTETRPVSTQGGNKNQPFTLYWFLNGMCVQEIPGPMKMISREPGANFNWRRFDNELSGYILHQFPCNNATANYNTSSSINGSDSMAAAANSTNTATYCDIPTSGQDDGPPHALDGQPAFGRASFVFYIMDIAVTGAAWPWLLWLEGNRAWQKRAQTILACTKGLTALFNVIAAAILVGGMAAVVSATSKTDHKADSDTQSVTPSAFDSPPMTNNIIGRRSNSTANPSAMPVISAGQTASNLVWISAISQLFACALLIFANVLLSQQYRTQGQRLGSSGRGSLPNMRQRPGSLPIYRPRDSNARRRAENGEEDEDLPPYQREDPLGRPPSIEGYTHSNGCTVVSGSSPGTTCIPLASVESSEASRSRPSLASSPSDNSGRQTPSPDYDAVGVEPVSLLGSEDTRRHGAVVRTCEEAQLTDVNGSSSSSSQNNETSGSQTTSSSGDSESSSQAVTQRSSPSSLAPTPVPEDASPLPRVPSPAILRRDSHE